MDFTEADRVEAEEYCRDIAIIADELEGHPSGLLRRSPGNADLTRAIAYKLLFQNECVRPVTIDPMRFAMDMLFVHRGLYGGPIAALEGDNRNFNKAFFGTPSYPWPLGCGWEHTWHIIGPAELYPDLEFSPTREYCLMEDSKFFGTRAQTNHFKTTSTSVTAVSSEAGKTKCEIVEQRLVREEKFVYHSRLPSGHNATICLEIASTESTVDYQVAVGTDEGSEGMGSKRWKPAREISTGQVLAVILNKTARVISDVRAEPIERSPVDIWFRLANDGREIAAQLTSIEPAQLYSRLAGGERLQLRYSRTELIAFARAALDRKRTQSASGVHLVLDCGFLIPASDAFETDVRTLLQEAPVGYESVWLVSRVDGSARCVFGSTPF